MPILYFLFFVHLHDTLKQTRTKQFYMENLAFTIEVGGTLLLGFLISIILLIVTLVIMIRVKKQITTMDEKIITIEERTKKVEEALKQQVNK